MAEFPMSVGVRDLLAAHVATSGWVSEIGAFPDDPDEVIMISDTGGVDPNPKYQLDFPTVQVMVRGKVSGYLDTWREGKAVKDILLGIAAQVINLDRWDGITMNGDGPAFIGRDESMRPLFTLNFAIILEPQDVALSNRLPL